MPCLAQCFVVMNKKPPFAKARLLLNLYAAKVGRWALGGKSRSRSGCIKRADCLRNGLGKWYFWVRNIIRQKCVLRSVADPLTYVPV